MSAARADNAARDLLARLIDEAELESAPLDEVRADLALLGIDAGRAPSASAGGWRKKPGRLLPGCWQGRSPPKMMSANSLRWRKPISVPCAPN